MSPFLYCTAGKNISSEVNICILQELVSIYWSNLVYTALHIQSTCLSLPPNLLICLPTNLSDYLSACLTCIPISSLPFFLSAYLPAACLSTYLPVYLSAYLPAACLSIFLPVYMSAYYPVCFSACLFLCLSVASILSTLVIPSHSFQYYDSCYC